MGAVNAEAFSMCRQLRDMHNAQTEAVITTTEQSKSVKLSPFIILIWRFNLKNFSKKKKINKKNFDVFFCSDVYIFMWQALHSFHCTHTSLFLCIECLCAYG